MRTADGQAICLPFPGSDPVWAPNGKRLLFHRDGEVDGTFGWLCNNAGLRRTEVACLGHVGRFAFMPNSFSLLVGNGLDVWRVDVSG